MSESDKHPRVLGRRRGLESIVKLYVSRPAPRPGEPRAWEGRIPDRGTGGPGGETVGAAGSPLDAGDSTVGTGGGTWDRGDDTMGARGGTFGAVGGTVGPGGGTFDRGDDTIGARGGTVGAVGGTVGTATGALKSGDGKVEAVGDDEREGLPSFEADDEPIDPALDEDLPSPQIGEEAIVAEIAFKLEEQLEETSATAATDMRSMSRPMEAPSAAAEVEAPPPRGPRDSSLAGPHEINTPSSRSPREDLLSGPHEVEIEIEIRLVEDEAPEPEPSAPIAWWAARKSGSIEEPGARSPGAIDAAAIVEEETGTEILMKVPAPIEDPETAEWPQGIEIENPIQSEEAIAAAERIDGPKAREHRALRRPTLRPVPGVVLMLSATPGRLRHSLLEMLAEPAASEGCRVLLLESELTGDDPSSILEAARGLDMPIVRRGFGASSREVLLSRPVERRKRFARLEEEELRSDQLVVDLELPDAILCAPLQLLADTIVVLVTSRETSLYESYRALRGLTDRRPGLVPFVLPLADSAEEAGILSDRFRRIADDFLGLEIADGGWIHLQPRPAGRGGSSEQAVAAAAAAAGPQGKPGTAQRAASRLSPWLVGVLSARARASRPCGDSAGRAESPAASWRGEGRPTFFGQLGDWLSRLGGA